MIKYYTLRPIRTAYYKPGDTIRYVANLAGMTEPEILKAMGYVSWVDLVEQAPSDTILTRKLNDICREKQLQTRIGEQDKYDKRREE